MDASEVNFLTEQESLEKIVRTYTLAAMGTGAIPVPAASAAIIAENAAMIGQIAACSGVPIGIKTVVEALSAATAVNVFGRQLFIEGARLLAWGTGNWWAHAALCGLGAATAGLQTYILGHLAIAICGNGGTLPQSRIDAVVRQAKREFAKIERDQ